MGKKFSFPPEYKFKPGVTLTQNKKSIERGFKKLQLWLKNPTPEKWKQIFSSNNAFGYQLRNYLLGRTDLGSVHGMKHAKLMFDAIDVKQYLKPDEIKKINDLTVGGKGVSLTSIRAKTFGRTLRTLTETKDIIRDFQNGEQWLRANKNVSESEIRKYANALLSQRKEQSKLGGFPFGDNSAKKLWSNLYRATYRGNRIKLLGEFADGELPIDEKTGKIRWQLQDKKGTPAWKRVKFQDLEARGKPIFSWDNTQKRGGIEKQIDKAFGKGFFAKSTAAYDFQQRIGRQPVDASGKMLRTEIRERILKHDLRTQPVRQGNKVNMIPTENEYKKYLTKKARRFHIAEAHHPLGVGVDPYFTEPALRFANRELGTLEKNLKSGKIDTDAFRKGILEINEELGGIRTLVDEKYTGSPKGSTQRQILRESLKFTSPADIRELTAKFPKIFEGPQAMKACNFLFKGKRLTQARGPGCPDQVREALQADADGFLKKVKELPSQGGFFSRAKNMAGQILSKIPKGGKIGALVAGAGAVGVGTWAMTGEGKTQEPSITDDMTYNAVEGKFVEANGDPADQSTVLNWIADHPTASGFAALPGAIGLGYIATAAAEKVKFQRR